MASIAFTIPAERAELLSEVSNDNYVVKDVIIPSEIVAKLEEARLCFQGKGSLFILEYFDTFYSVLHHADTLPANVVVKAYNDLIRAVNKLNENIQLSLDNKNNLDDEFRAKIVIVLKMLLYMYTQFVIYLEQKKRKDSEDLVSRGKNKQKNKESCVVQKSKVVKVLNDIIQRDINLFWEPPVVEHDFVNMLGELCLSFLQNPGIKQEKEVQLDIFGLFGNLIKFYDYGKTFVTRLIQSIRMYEHVVHCVLEGVKLLVEQFNLQGLVHNFVKEATEWQVDEAIQDVQGTRCCSIFLTELAILTPKLMLPEVVYLNQYLSFESPPLRISVLNVITEVISHVLTRHDLTEEERDLRDECLDVLIEHILDTTAQVRAKVIQNIARLQRDIAIPLNYQNEVLKKVIQHLHDKGANVRKAAINCITVFLEHNPFGANLQLSKTEEELRKKVELLNRMESCYKEAQNAKIAELEAEWTKNENDIKTIIQEQLDQDDNEETDEDNEPQPQLHTDQVVTIVRNYLQEKKYVKAFKMCKLLKDKIEIWKNMRKMKDEQEVNLYLTVLHSFFINTAKLTDELRTGAGMTDEDIKKIETLEKSIKYLDSTVAFLKVLDTAIKPMKQMLFTQNIGDMHEAIHFFVTAYQFQIDKASEGVSEMLKLMQYSEPERKEAIVEAFKTIYLTTNTTNMMEHTTTILNRLIKLRKEVTYNDLNDLQNIVSEWTAKGILDNSVIDRCWQYYTQRASVTEDEAWGACELLRMAAIGRRTIITKNINVVTAVAFSDKFKDNMLFLASSCRLLAVAGTDKIDIQSNDAPFKVKYVDPMFKSLSDILVENFFKEVPYYSEAMQAGVDFIFRVCSKPTEVCEKMMRQISEKIKEGSNNLPLTTRFCRLLGFMAVQVLRYLDDGIYRELKRRNYVRDSRKENKKNKKSRETRHSINSTIVENANDSVLVGAAAEDTDSEYVLNVLENSVVNNCGLLGQFSPMLTTICQRPDLYDNVLLQQAAVTALMRYMLVSSTFCRDNIRLLFTIFEKTIDPEIKCTILIHCSDLLTRFPNIVEPWSPRIYGGLRDPLVRVRKTAFFALSNLILRDMIRAHSHISEMAACLIDDDEGVCGMCKTFFGRLAQKENNLANVIPDIFSHIVKADNISEESLRFIMKFLFDLVDNSKRMENLVDRFCCKYTPNEDSKLNRNITYCLSLINYNDKALRKLHEKFPMYKHHVHDAEIYAFFQQIISECSKPKVGKVDLKPIVADIETCIASVFEVNEDGQPTKPLPVVQSTKKQRNRSNRKKSRKQTQRSDSEFDSDDEVVIENKKSRKNKLDKKLRKD